MLYTQQPTRSPTHLTVPQPTPWVGTVHRAQTHRPMHNPIQTVGSGSIGVWSSCMRSRYDPPPYLPPSPKMAHPAEACTLASIGARPPVTSERCALPQKIRIQDHHHKMANPGCMHKDAISTCQMAISTRDQSGVPRPTETTISLGSRPSRGHRAQPNLDLARE